MRTHECPGCGTPHSVLYGSKVKCPCGITADITPPAADTQKRGERERDIREMLAHMERDFRQRAEPLVKELAQIEASKPIIHYLDLSEVEKRVLSMMQADDATAQQLEEDDPCPKCGKQLGDGPGGGAVCPDKECGYWFCY